MASTATEKKKYTYEDYLKTPDDVRYELIEGDLLMTPSPVTKHQRILRELGFELLSFVRVKDLGEIFLAPFDVHLDNENVVEPDILFISKQRLHIIGEKNVQGPPDLVIEILSESTANRDLVQKKRLYAKFGVKEYWIVIPGEEIVEIYTLKDALYVLCKSFGKENAIESPLLKGLKIDLKKIF
ncbi:MAG: restriction endonuclease [Nitrospirae bacterium RIFCSPLOW2_12_42_9]|nr:MAG: restriction endonuclease [Nitrospirae bacterium RIFCSPLOW2_12_42_9]HAS17553.1 restriction endonuclease [Nitrospiraceae bacterium]HBI23071.1 restriction endonuclease [Nitrospiraceae bacterium]